MAKKRSATHSSPRWTMPFATAWIIVLIQLSSFVHGLAMSSATDQRPRAALVSLAHEHDLPAILSSMSQLEETYNRRYRYPWVFFSTQPLTEEFRQQTSNATGAVCLYEVILKDNLVSPNQPFDLNALPMDHQTDGEVLSGNRHSKPFVGQISRWNSGPFAREKRLKDYDWVWRIEPGAQFTHDITFDVFRFMRDHEIAYGFNEALLDKDEIRTHSQPVKSFIDEHPDLLHADADLSWLLGSNEAPLGVTSQGNRSRSPDSRVTDCGWSGLINSMVHEILRRVGCCNTDRQQGMGYGGYGDDDDTPPTFDIGALSFFRSQGHQDLVNHLDAAGDFYRQPLRDMAVPTISASMFLPQKSVWNYRKRDPRHSHRPSPPAYTQKPKLRTFETNVVFKSKGSNRMVGPQRRDSIREQEKNPVESMAERFALWNQMAQDFSRQDAIPGLRSGDTVIDERNFSMDPKRLRPVELLY
ncbi:glycosyltransferase family 15 protein [Trichoderma longibrachiatum]|uniref:Glycosyltransferase family 15 protein n=1 Tax=Trichoderma longibrachiatum ATCC 18648 TaxID=983965 RepID=A0A2T4BR95_TRILO|nr:glycosyltransferase family 15 protein [Trichoderma longibrachiatum ATCC 18648]